MPEMCCNSGGASLAQKCTAAATATAMSSYNNHPAVENGLRARSFLVSRCAGGVLGWLRAPLLFSNGPVQLLLELFADDKSAPGVRTTPRCVVQQVLIMAVPCVV